MDQDKTPKELIEDMYNLFATFKQRMEDPNFIQIENSLSQLVEAQAEMKAELKEMKRQLLNPYDGVIVETKKNTDFRLEQEAKKEIDLAILEEHKSLVRWRSNITKVAVAVLTSIGAIIAFFLNKYFGL
jgi:hypothetical protein